MQQNPGLRLMQWLREAKLISTKPYKFAQNFIFWLLAKILKILQTSYFVQWYGPFEKLNSKILKILQIKYVVQWHGPFGK